MSKNAQKIGTVYHLEHGRDYLARRGLEYDLERVSLTPQSSYGLRDICESVTVAERVLEIKLRPSCAKRLARRFFPSRSFLGICASCRS